ncbi:hypothetical protein [Prosthecomicrobium hirschii]|uniref:hypothetical protein n=1 Tax=Prosthecodimorpha hirschii TaxID=665126 RepID=UPI00222023B5|nr:hypothetical protein [Prosthecomicrobium hirschii]MCW1844147.1 hypothetical protein [Prosthecomicrobium hirschii]
MTAHTPGPWEAVGSLVRTMPHANNRGGMSGGYLIAEAPVVNEGRYADARLISAAPELLDAARVALEWIESHMRARGYPEDVVVWLERNPEAGSPDAIYRQRDAVRAAIAKAEGRI